MTHLPFIAAAYSLGVLIPIGFGLAAFQRMTAARRKLAAIDPRAGRVRTDARVGGKKRA